MAVKVFFKSLFKNKLKKVVKILLVKQIRNNILKYKLAEIDYE